MPRALDRHAELLAQRQPITAARALAVTEAIECSAPAPAAPLDRGPERRPSLAHDMLGLEDEFRSCHGYPLTRPTRRRREVLEGKRDRRRSLL